jgi:hypothetical protein
LVWHGHIEDQRYYVMRALSGGGVPRMPEAFTFGYSIKVDFEYVQEVAADGSASWPKRRLSWTLDGDAGDDTATETCHGAGSLELGAAGDPGDVTAAQRQALEATCERKTLATAFRLYENLPRTPPLPWIPAVSALDENCAYREEVGSRRTSIWLTPDVEAVVEMDTKPGSQYARFVPEPGKSVELTVKTVPAFPARFRFVIDGEHTSHLFGYAGNATLKSSEDSYGGSFFSRYLLQHLAKQYTDASPDLIFDPGLFERRAWSLVSQDVVETATEGTTATASVTAMDYGAIGKIRVYAKYKCGGWTPARVAVGNAVHDSVSVPLDEDGNLIADALSEYKGDPGSDDDAEPEGDGTKGDGLTTFEEYRGFMTAGRDCHDRNEDVHRRTRPEQKNLFVAARVWDPSTFGKTVEAFGAATGLTALSLCEDHLSSGLGMTLTGGYAGPPSETRIVNFTLQRGKQTEFEGKTISLGAQHGVLVGWFHEYSPLLAGMMARAVPVKEGWEMGPPVLTNLLAVNSSLGEEKERFAIIHELGHAVGIPHHSDTRVGWALQTGIENVIPEWSPLQAAGISLQDNDAGAILGSASPPDLLLIAPGPGCGPKDQAAAYRDGQFAGCLTFSIVRRGQQHSGPVSCPMRYQPADFYEPPGVKAEYGEWSGVVTDDPNVRPEASASAGGLSQVPAGGIDARGLAGQVETRHAFLVDLWRGNLRRWPKGDPPASWGTGKYCDSVAGTDVNAPGKSDNLAGDEGRKEGCRRYVVVNDLARREPK